MARAGIKDVAQRAGVSVGTVSNVLNRPDAVSQATRERVQAAIDELGFVRNATARQLRRGAAQTVGVIVLDLSNPFYTELARGIEDRLARDNLTLTLCSSDEDPEREVRFLRLFAEQGVAGVLVTPSAATEANLTSLARLGVRAVLLDAHSERFPSVGVDDVAGARAAVTHLLEQGHRRIGFVNGPGILQQCVDRSAGSRQAVLEYGLDPEAVLVEVATTLSADGGQAATATLLDAADPPTACFAVNDIVALGVMRELRHRGLAIPGDVAVVGYDDIHFAAELMTPLSSVRQPMRRLGEVAADLLLNQAPSTEHVVFTPELIVRASSSSRRR